MTLVQLTLSERAIIFINPAHVVSVEVVWDVVGICRLYIRLVNTPELITHPVGSIAEREKLLRALGAAL